MNINKKIYAVYGGLTLLLLSMGYSKINNINNVGENNLINSTELLETIINSNSKTYESYVKNFNLGAVSIGENEEKVEVNLEGIIGVPKNKNNAPIVFIMPESGVTNNSYLGFDYLVKNLSQAGFLTVLINTDLSIDESQQELVVEDKILNLVFEEHIGFLKNSIMGKNNKYPLSLYKKGNLDEMLLIGESNLGRTIFNIANQQESNDLVGLKGLLSITPNSGVSSYVDIPITILSTEYSNDTSASFDIYNEIEKDLKRESILQLSYLVDGNSSKFNRFLNVNTVLNDEKSSILEETFVSDVTYEEFLSSYIIDFANYLFNNSIKNSLYSPENSTIHHIYKQDVLSKLLVKNKKEIFNSSHIDNLTLNGVKATPVIESSISSLDTAIDFNDPATNIELPLINLEWNTINSKFSINPKSNNKNFNEYSSLSIEWALNNSSELSKSDLKKISIILEDSKGNMSEVILVDELPLNKIEGVTDINYKNVRTISNLSRLTPISETRIPLDLFKGIDLKDISNIHFNFKDNESGSIFIKNILLKK